MPGFITRQTLTENRELVIEIFDVKFYEFAMSRPEGTPFLTAWAQYNLPRTTT